ncbi:hypothetical protein L6164_007787 [Bauhinia variegata]|uniref:Uncharacterized protein n=1 Tax=Bauhinia variegata TaxID=167791 RepID=A0ACB9PG19_BAUVA|nr:hypothetical protein L6164_007787 [Bauhinia variegata]
MYANENGPQSLYRRITDNIHELRGFFSWDKLWHADGYNDEQLAWMLFVDGCAVLQILKKANPSKPEALKVKVDILLLVLRDLFLLENQLPYNLLWLLGKDEARFKEEAKFKESMFCFCELQNMFIILESPQRFREEKDRTKRMIRDNTPTHLLDCLRTIILISDEVELSMPGDVGTTGDLNESEASNTSTFSDVARIYANRKINEKYTSYRNIQELKTAAIRVKRQKNISLTNISFSSSLFGGKWHLPPLRLDDSTIPTLLNLVAYEMCPDFKNKYEICSYVKLLDLLIDYPEDVKELRSSGILHNSLGSDEEVVELFNTISCGLVYNPFLYSGIRAEVEKHYKRKLSIWMAEAYYTYFKSPWTLIALLAAVLALVFSALQTWKQIEPDSKSF